MEEDAHVVAESRWPMAAAVLATIVLTILLPEGTRTIPRLLLPAIEGALLVVLILGDPGRIDRRSRTLRWLSVGLVSILVLSSLAATGKLIELLIDGGKETDSAGELLAAGSIVWTLNILAFSLLYWELDSGGAAARAHRLRRLPDFAFPQQMNPDLARPDWRPQFIDYLYLGFTSATAFSPTDAMPLVPWAKLAMAVQSLISLAILGLVIARAVNVLN